MATPIIDPPAAQARAENALSRALHELRRLDADPERAERLTLAALAAVRMLTAAVDNENCQEAAA